MSRYTDRERAIYQSPLPGEPRYDPLALQRQFWAATRGKWNDLLADLDAAAPATRDSVGDITRGPESHVVAAVAEDQLVAAARTAFKVAAFPDGPPDAVILDAMDHFLEWLSGKD